MRTYHASPPVSTRAEVRYVRADGSRPSPGWKGADRKAWRAVRVIRRSLLVLGSCSALLAGACLETRETPDLEVKILYPLGGSRTDRTFGYSAFTGVVNARLQFDFYIDEFSPATLAEAQGTWDELTRGPTTGQELLVLVGYDYAEIVARADCQYGGRSVLILDTQPPGCEHLMSAVYRTFAPSFLAGVAAMQVSASKRAAAIGGMEIPTVTNFIRGFQQGVEHAGGELVAIEYLAADSGGFSQPEAARAAALRLYEQEGVDAIIPVAGWSSMGVIEAALAAPPDQRWYTFGVDSDMSYYGINVVVASILKRLDRTVTNVLLATARGSFQAGNLVETMAAGGTELLVNPVFAAQVDEAVAAAMVAAIAADEADREAGR